MAQPYRLEVDASKLRVLIARTHFSPDPASARVLGEGIRKAAMVVQARAVFNVTGYPVSYDGGVFRVQVRTGTLRGSIELEWPYGSLFTARVYVNGTYMTPPSGPGGARRPTPVSEYAGSIEWGHDQIDLKLTMKGKTVPFFGAKAEKARGPYAAKGLKPIGGAGDTGYGSKWRSAALDSKLLAKGKSRMEFEKKGGAGRGSSYFIAFRKVGNVGWIIPEAKPRPFMKAAVENTRPKVRRIIADAGLAMLDPNR